MTIPTVRWEWVITGDRQVRKRPTIPGAPPPKPAHPAADGPLPKMGYYFYNAAFSERIEAGDDIPKQQPKKVVQKEPTLEDLDNWDMGIRSALERAFRIGTDLRLVITRSPQVVNLPMKMTNRTPNDERLVATTMRSSLDTRLLEWNTGDQRRKCRPRASYLSPKISRPSQ